MKINFTYELIHVFCKDEIVLFIQKHEHDRVKKETVLRPYFRHFLYTDCFGNSYVLEEHRHPGISYRLRKNGNIVKLNWLNQMLLRKYILKYATE